MASIETSKDPEATLGTSADKNGISSSELLSCCVNTINQHALYNPMMVCTECKQIIKCFREERSYKNYLTFCKSRRRPVSKGYVDQYYTVVFRSYETYR